MSYITDIFRRLAYDPCFVAHLRRFQGKPALDAPELNALLRLDRLEGELAQAKYDIIHNAPLRAAAHRTQAFTLRKNFNDAAKPRGLFARSVELALRALGSETQKNLLDTYETSIPEIDGVAERLRAARAKLDSGAKLRDLKKEIGAVHDAAFDVTLRLARIREGLSPEDLRPKAEADENGLPFGASNRPRPFGVP